MFRKYDLHLLLITYDVKNIHKRSYKLKTKQKEGHQGSTSFYFSSFGPIGGNLMLNNIKIENVFLLKSNFHM